MTWLVTYVSLWEPDLQRSEPWVCPGWMDATSAMHAFQAQCRSVKVLSITAAPQGVEA
jgi:hypothetical protein